MIATLRDFRIRAPLRLETRIGMAMVLAVGAILILTFAQLLLIPHGKFTVFQREWLVTTVKGLTEKIAAAPASERLALIEALPEQQWFYINWSLAGPAASQRRAPPPLPHLDQRLESDIRDGLQSVRALSVSSFARAPQKQQRPLEAGQPDGEARSSPPDAPGRGPPPRFGLSWLPRGEHVLTVIPALTPAQQRDRPEALVPAVFEIEAQLSDGSWLQIRPKQAVDYAWIFDLLLPLIGSAVVIVALSILTARRILAPLSALTGAAQKLGIGRTATPIPSEGLEEFASVAHALNDMHTRLSGFVEERTQMLAAISHDIRTGLTRLRLNVEDVENPALKHSLGEEISEMEKMISATLVFARNDAQSEAAKDVDLAALLISLIDEQTDKGHEALYVGPDHLVVRCQRLSIKRAFINLIDNAIKYGGKVEARLQSAAEAVEVIIRDEGPGIAADLREKVFAPFQRLEGSRSRNTGGVGLGLTIARDAIRAHMGTIELGSADGGGLAVRVLLPRP